MPAIPPQVVALEHRQRRLSLAPRAQLTLGVDRDSGLVAAAFDERNPAVKALLSMAINACRDAGKYIGICGQGPSDHPDFARWLVDHGIASISLNPDTVVETWLYLAGESTA